MVVPPHVPTMMPLAKAEEVAAELNELEAKHEEEDFIWTYKVRHISESRAFVDVYDEAGILIGSF